MVAVSRLPSLSELVLWGGHRFVASNESVASNRHKQAIVDSMPKNTVRTLIYSGRPLRTFLSEYVNDWEKTESRRSSSYATRDKFHFRSTFVKSVTRKSRCLLRKCSLCFLVKRAVALRRCSLLEKSLGI